MPELRHLLDELAGAPGPEPRADADALYDAGRRQYRRRAAVTSALAVVPVLALLAAIAWWPSRPTTPPSKAPSSVPAPTGAAGWAALADRQHAYALLADTLYGTDDAGRTWTRRSTNAPANLAVLAPSVLLAEPYSAGGTYPPMRLSTDGGRTWATLADGHAPTPTVPLGAALVCRTPGGTGCKLSAVSPLTRRLEPLANQPELLIPSAWNLVEPLGQLHQGGDRIIVAGEAPANGRPAVATSDDRGKTWTTHAFADLPCTKDCHESIQVQASPDGSTLYAVIDDSNAHQVYVYERTDTRPWTRTGATIPYNGADTFYRSYLTADGAHLLGLTRTIDQHAPELNYVELRNGHYEPATLDGLPPTAMPARPTRAGAGYYALDTIGHALYQSTDGRHWTTFPLPTG